MPIAPLLPRRYLVAFDPKELPHHFVDVLIIGGGIAGLRAALGIPESFRVLIVTKDEVRESNSHYAQGGIASVLDPEDRFDNHIADTLEAGKGLCDPAVVEMVVREAPTRIGELIEWGTHFDEVNGQVALGLEGGHSHARIVHALGDETGREIMRAVILEARKRRNIRIWQNSVTIDLVTHEGECRGALVWDRRRGFALVWARAVVLATGGAGQLYRETTNPSIATADGHAMAFRAGAVLRDMEFMQFHPTVLYIAGSTRHLLTEALRGEGAYLRDRYGERFMPAYHPLAELAPRDVVSLAIAAQMAKSQHPSVYLDLSHLDADHIRRRFPGIDRLCRNFDLDITRDPIPACPGAH
jgi:L-aspartate oxidase